MNEFKVDIITAEKALLSGAPAGSVTAPGTQGTFQILPGHTTFLSTLETGPVSVVGPGGELKFAVSGGFCEVMPGHVRILADHAQGIEGLDQAALKTDLQNLEKQLQETDPFSEQAEKLRAEQKYLQLQKEL